MYYNEAFNICNLKKDLIIMTNHDISNKMLEIEKQRDVKLGKIEKQIRFLFTKI